MKKVLAVVLVLTLAICFAACGKKGDDTTTTENSLTASLPDEYSSTSDSVPDVEPQGVSSTEADSATMILTTQAGQTMPTVSTTAFVPTPVTTTTPGGTFTVPTMSAPSVSYSSQPYSYSTVPGGGSVPAYTPTSRISPTFSTLSPSYTAPTPPAQTTQRIVPSVPTLTNVSNTTTPIITTTRPTTAPTTTGPVTRSSKTVVINDYATTSDKKLVVTIDPKGWDGAFQNNSQNITVKVDGVSKSAPASVKGSAKNADGYQYITIDLSELSVPEGASVQFTVPSAFLQTTSGAQYNSAFSGAYTMM